MSISVKRSNLKPTGGKYNNYRKKKKMDIGNDFIPVKLKEGKKLILRTLGGNTKVRAVCANKVNVVDASTGKTQIANIKTVKENAANPNFVRMNIITKGAVVETELGLVKITSKPGQHGVINGVLVKK